MGNIKLILTRVLVVGCGLVAIELGIGSINSVRADNFYPTGDVSNCDFATATSLSYFMLPQNCSTAGCLSFNNSDVYGSNGYFPETHKITDVAYLLYPNAHRVRGIVDSVAVPPNTKVDVGLYVHNYSGHTVSVPSAYLFVSRATTSNGDWSRLGAGGTVGSINYRYFNTNQIRSGRYVLTNNLGTYQPNSHATVPLGRTAYSFITIQPIQILSRTATPEFSNNGNLRIKYDTVIRNISEYNLSDIQIIDNLPSGEIFDQTVAFSSGQMRTFTYFANLGTIYPNNIINSPLRIIDPNRHREYSAVANGNSFDPETKTILVNRTDFGTPIDWMGRQPDFSATPIGDYYYVELIPYSVYSDETVTNVYPDLIMDFTVSDYDEVNVKNNIIDTGYEDENERKVKYYIETNNSGNAPANNVYISIDITEIFEFTEITEISNEGNQLSKNMPDGTTVHYVVWVVDTIMPNEKYELYFEVIYDMNISDRSVFNIQSSVGCSGVDTITSNVTTTNLVPILIISIVNITEDVVIPNDTITYELSFSNLGSDNAYEVEISTHLSPFVIPIHNSDASFVYDADKHSLIWNFEILKTNDENSLSFDVQTISPLNIGTEITTEVQIMSLNHLNPVKDTNIVNVGNAGCIEGNVLLGNLPLEHIHVNLSFNNDINIYSITNEVGEFIFTGLPFDTEILLQLEYSTDLQLISTDGNKVITLNKENGSNCEHVDLVLKEKGDLVSEYVVGNEVDGTTISNRKTSSTNKLAKTGESILFSFFAIVFLLSFIIKSFFGSERH